MEFEIPSEIINNYGIKLLVVFGSAGTVNEKNDSDLDLAFLTDELLSISKEEELLSDLICFYKRDDIDLINLYKAEPGLKLSISREGRVIYEKQGAFSDFQLYAARIFADTKYLRKMRKEVLKEKVAKL